MNNIIEEFQRNNFYKVATVTDDSVDYSLMLRLEKRGKTIRPSLTKYDKITNMVEVHVPYHDDKAGFYSLYLKATRSMQLELLSALRLELGLYDIVYAINVYSKEVIASYCKKLLEIIYVNSMASMSDEFIKKLEYKPVYERNMIIAACKHLEFKLFKEQRKTA